jgi:hypothetical protein
MIQSFFRRRHCVALALAACACLAALAIRRHEQVVRAAETALQQIANSPVKQRSFYGRMLEPKDNVVLEGAGQSDEASFAAITQALPNKPPLLSMSYVDLRDDLPSYFAKLHAELQRYPNLIIPQIGLSLNRGQGPKHYEAEVAKGADDARLQQFCAGLKSLDRPIFVRPGYEFNGPWNGYEATTYAAAFRHIVSTVRACGPRNVAFVWDWSPDAELQAEAHGERANLAASRYMAFYPGDASVDWWAINVFDSATLTSAATATFFADADRHRFPVMIAESTPYKHSTSEGQHVVDAWYAPYFGLIRSTPGIKAFCYIDWDWGRFPQWSSWGDARIERNPAVLSFYRIEMQRPLYAGATDKTSTLNRLRAK